MLTKEQEEHVDRLDAAFNKMRSQLDWLVEMVKWQNQTLDYQNKLLIELLQDTENNKITQAIKAGIESANQSLSEKANYDTAAKSKENEVGTAL